MSSRKFAYLAIASCALAGASVAQAQTCAGSLSCTATAFTYNSSGAGPVLVVHSSNTGTNPVVGLSGTENAAINGSAGVFGEDVGACTASVSGLPAAGVTGSSAGTNGVLGISNIGPAGVAGYNLDSGVCPAAVSVAGFLGYKSGANLYGVYSSGNIAATGTKSFIEPHPTDASKEIRFVSLEGPESGTYFRGTATTVKGFATIAVPESFRLVTAQGGLTAVVTPTGKLVQIAVISKSLDKIVVQSSQDVTFDYVVNGVRKAFPSWEAISSNQDFIPDGPGDQKFFTYPAETQRRLVATGIYNTDGTVSLDKAREMGWDLLWEKQAKLSAQATAAQASATDFLRFASLHR
jgi:hypothetical protein